MAFDRDKQSKLLERAKRILEKADASKKEKRQANGIEPFIAGGFYLLTQNDFVDELVSLIKNEGESLSLVIDALVASLGSDNTEVRHRALTMLCLYWESKSFEPGVADIVSFVKTIATWYEIENEYFPGLPKLNQNIISFTKRLLKEKEFEAVEELLHVFSRVQTGVLFKITNIQNETKQTLGELAQQEILDSLLEEHNTNADERRSIASILVYLGKKASSYLLQKMMHSNCNTERMRMSDLLTCYGGSVVPILNNCLEKNPPWFVIRNIFRIYGEMEDSSLYNDIKAYASYKDIRVQQELLKSVLRMGGPRLVDRLFEILVQVEPALQIKVIYRLNEEDDPEILENLSNFLESSLHLLLRREEVLIALVITIQQYPSERILFLLRTLEEECRLRPRLERLKDVVLDAISVTEPILRHQKRKVVDEVSVSVAHHPHEHKRALRIVRKIRNDVNQKAQDSDLNKVGVMYEAGVKLIAEREFVAANMVLEQLMTLSPESLEKVVRLEELIEKSQDHRWTQFRILTASLNPYFSEAEMKVLVSAMSIEEYRVGEYIVQAGQADFCLYFILNGFLQMQWEQEGRNDFLKRLSKGESFGNGHFLDASLWTINVLTVAPAKLAVLSINDFRRLLTRHPQLEDKMDEFCRVGHTIPDLLKMSGEERRRFPRYPTHAAVQIVVLDIYGKKISRSLKGVLLDVSEGGIALLVRFASDSLVQSFLGRIVFSEIYTGGKIALKCRGRVVSARAVDDEEQRYSLHLSLSEPLTRDEVELILP